MDRIAINARLIRAETLDSLDEGDYLTLTDGTYCRVTRTWSGKDNAWLEVAYRKARTNIRRNVQRYQIAGPANPPLTDEE